MNIRCKISNQNTTVYPEIVIRKLYQVLFWEADLKTFHIYSALVFGANTKDGSNNTIRKTLLKNYDIKISFSVSESQSGENNPVINHYSKEKAIITEFDVFKPVWGTDSKILQSSDEYNLKYNELFKPSIETQKAVNSNYIFLKDPKKNDLETNTICKLMANEADPLETMSFRVKIGEDELDPHIELLTLTQTTISFKKKQGDNLNFTLEFEDEQKFDCKDSSMYFILPVGYDSPEKNLLIEMGSGANPKNLVDNAYQSLKTDRDKYLNEWIDKRIEERKYYRVIEDSLKKFDHNVKKINSSFKIESLVNPILKQFIFGLIISIFFAYGLDQTRLMNFRSLFFRHYIFPPDLNFTLTFGLLTLSCLFKINIGYTKENEFSYYARTIGVFSSLIWFLWMFFFCSSNFYSSPSISNPLEFPIYQLQVSHLLNVLSLILNFSGWLLVLIIHRDEISISLKEHFIKLLKRY